MNFRAAHWADLHEILYNELPPDVFLWGHHFISFCTSEDKVSVKIAARDLETDEIVEIVGDLLVGADGCLSSVLQTFLPNFKLRYMNMEMEQECSILLSPLILVTCNYDPFSQTKGSFCLV